MILRFFQGIASYRGHLNIGATGITVIRLDSYEFPPHQPPDCGLAYYFLPNCLLKRILIWVIDINP